MVEFYYAGKEGTQDQPEDPVCSDAVTVLVCYGEERAELEGEALSLPPATRRYPHKIKHHYKYHLKCQNRSAALRGPNSEMSNMLGGPHTW